ncbi:MAG: PLP-dependent aspartate aminotransferase family protein [Clostridia bacterium]|nr:PLP-dependent aspartate aminotransferase family protein [Clostridia bacterium]
MEFETLCLHADDNKKDEWGTITMPVCQAATFVHKGVGVQSQYSYSRLSNPTRSHLENTVAKLEGGVAAFAFSSGMAAITTVMKLFKQDAHIIASEDLYGGSLRLFRNVNTVEGMSFDFTDTGDIARVRSLINKNTKAIYCETPSNPLMQVSDIAELAALAHEKGLLLIVDNTFLTPYFQRPLELGADIVIHSGTKYLGGHNDALAGFAVAKTPEIAEKIAYYSKTIGACLAPWDSFLIERGIKTLPLRMDRINANAKLIAEWLRGRKEVKKVYYTGFEDHAGYAVSKKQATGFGGMISFEVESKALAENILSNVKVLQYAESLGGVESLITYPMLQTHADVPVEEREMRGINDRFLRISVGIENAKDLIDDLKQAFER